MQSVTIVILVVLAVLNVILLVLVLRRKPAKQDDTGIQLLLQHINDLSRTVDSKIGESTKEMNHSVRTQFTESSRLIKEITEELVKVGEGQRQVVSFADQLRELQDILKNPKQRGVLGEYYLETLLKNTLAPGSYEMQYKLGKTDDGNDLVPDAVVFVKDKIIPIDSKFSLENYNRIAGERDETERAKLEKVFLNDLKNRIVETSKYIQPSQGTMEFAFMFIPHEAIYYDLLINKIGAVTEDTENLIQRAASKYKVIIVSPTSLLAYLQTVLQGLKALKIEEKAKDIIKRVDELARHMKSYEDYHNKLGNSLTTTVNHYMASGKEFKKIDKDVMRITGSSAELEPLAVDKPALED